MISGARSTNLFHVRFTGAGGRKYSCLCQLFEAVEVGAWSRLIKSLESARLSSFVFQFRVSLMVSSLLYDYLLDFMRPSDWDFGSEMEKERERKEVFTDSPNSWTCNRTSLSTSGRFHLFFSNYLCPEVDDMRLTGTRILPWAAVVLDDWKEKRTDCVERFLLPLPRAQRTNSSVILLLRANHSLPLPRARNARPRPLPQLLFIISHCLFCWRLM